MGITKFASTVKTNTCHSCAHARVCLSSHSPNNQSSLFNTLQFSARLLKRGEHLCYQGQYSENLYIIRAGILKSSITKQNGEEFVMGFYLPPDLFGWEGIDESHRSVSITALDQSNICIVPAEKMFVLTQQIPALGAQLLQMISRRIQQDNVALLRTNAQQRVATFLLQLASRYQKLGFPKYSLQLIMTHQDVANYLRITPCTISRIFHELEHKKMIKIEKHRIQLLDVPNMYVMAESN